MMKVIKLLQVSVDNSVSLKLIDVQSYFVVLADAIYANILCSRCWSVVNVDLSFGWTAMCDGLY